MPELTPTAGLRPFRVRFLTTVAAYMLVSMGSAPAVGGVFEVAQIIIGSGSIDLSRRLRFGNSPALPPFSAFQAEIANAGPATSSGLLFYQTPGLTWSCQGINCGAQGRLERFTLETCVALARQVGPLLRLSAAGQNAITEDIDACNAIAAGQTVPRPEVIAPPGGIAPPSIRLVPPSTRIAPPGQ